MTPVADQISDLIAARLADALERRQARRAQRAEMAARRTAGLAKRHAAKLARSSADPSPTQSTSRYFPASADLPADVRRDNDRARPSQEKDPAMTNAQNVATVATGARQPRCRMADRLGDRCPNPSINDDIKTVQICARHALAAANLLVEAGAIQIRYADVTTGGTAR